MTAEPLFDVLSALTEWTCKIFDNINAVLFAENLIVEYSGLFVVGVRMLVGIPTDRSTNFDF